jgi:hypothetical protein
VCVLCVYLYVCVCVYVCVSLHVCNFFLNGHLVRHPCLNEMTTSCASPAVCLCICICVCIMLAHVCIQMQVYACVHVLGVRV